jgi:hypothetical protein
MTSAENPYAGQGSVLLDIGGEVGALVVTMPAVLVGEEVEIRPSGHDHLGRDQHRLHVAVVARPVRDRLIPSLVFPELAAGEYELYRRPHGRVELSVSVTGGTVTETAWPAR